MGMLKRTGIIEAKFEIDIFIFLIFFFNIWIKYKSVRMLIDTLVLHRHGDRNGDC